MSHRAVILNILRNTRHGGLRKVSNAILTWNAKRSDDPLEDMSMTHMIVPGVNEHFVVM